ncbi:DUF202 domain-containing protein [Streptomyces luomodiensis]|uniref:DUF202 domain-containing protein n=1 Tax=Streptomyces luomodiensis TaxID=3026192 RepID=A0ABY9UUL4_9ACTN|nr:DUF202 domain-containing protein [Streptomyces sp. SCA4-21]WNE95677.1 DUF202 domain-containing protein [Streptomyces sp. SCA4-21]
MPEGNRTDGTRTQGRDRDPGLQPERTRLAWRRTTLACAVAASLAGRQTLHGGADPAALVILALVVLAWLAFLVSAHRRIRAMNASRPPALSPRAAAAAVTCTLALALLGAATLR